MDIRSIMSPGALAPARSVSSVELLFDLVFVFVVSQAASAVGADHSWAGLAHIMITLGLVWWMYDAFAWSTNTMAPTDVASRLRMVTATGCFLISPATRRRWPSRWTHSSPASGRGWGSLPSVCAIS